MNNQVSSGLILCPCGIRMEGTERERRALYRAHRCCLHEPEPNSDWPMAVWGVFVLIFLSFIFTKGWGMLL